MAFSPETFGALNGKIGEAGGIASLNENGKVPESQLPSYVDDVEEYSSASAFPEEGETGKIYVATDTGICYRWTGTVYTAITDPTKEDAIKPGSISLSTTWTDNGDGTYSQTVTVTGATVTSNSLISLQPTPAQLAQLMSDGVTALVITNNAGTLMATALGAETTTAMTIACTVTEVSA